MVLLRRAQNEIWGALRRHHDKTQAVATTTTLRCPSNTNERCSPALESFRIFSHNIAWTLVTCVQIKDWHRMHVHRSLVVDIFSSFV